MIGRLDGCTNVDKHILTSLEIMYTIDLDLSHLTTYYYRNDYVNRTIRLPFPLNLEYCGTSCIFVLACEFGA